MKCPKCGNETTQLPMSLPEKNYCPECGWFREIQQTLIDSAELLRLIEEAIGNYRNCPSVTPLEHRMLILNAVLDYLKGDPKPLKKLAGEK